MRQTDSQKRHHWCVPVIYVCFVSCLPLMLAGSARGQEDSATAEVVATDVVATEVEPTTEPKTVDWQGRVDEFFGAYLVAPLVTILFFDFGTGVPIVVAWLSFGAIFFTFRMGLINVRGFPHALRVTRGDYDDPNDTGEVTHFQALTSALSATVGLGNIAGVAIAVGRGGPGAIFWMMLAGFFGMTSKFVECTLAQMYRHVDPDGRVLGGPMRYLQQGLAEKSMGGLGWVLAILFTILCIGGSFGGGCAFQVVQSLGVVSEHVPLLDEQPWIYGLVMAFLVGIVIIGGIRRIAATAEKVVPSMCVIYVLTAVTILLLNYERVPWAFGEILRTAFSDNALYGGLLGVLVVGVQRAAFSNEAGVGSAAIAHSAAKTEHPVREGIVALMGPFIDTVVICTMTGLVIVITGAYDVTQFPSHQALIDGDEGAKLTSEAFGSVVSWFPYILAVAAALFAYSTMISWSYYGERCWSFLFGKRASIYYKLLFLVFVFLGSIVTATNILVFSDLMILSMAFPNILGLLFLSGKVKAALERYWASFKAGEFKTFR